MTATSVYCRGSQPRPCSDVRVFYNPYRYYYRPYDLTGQQPVERVPSPPFVLLAHELIHALHFVEGTFDCRLVPLEFMLSPMVSVTRWITVDEYRTVGIPFVGPSQSGPAQPARRSGSQITENDIRKENGLSPRLRY